MINSLGSIALAACCAFALPHAAAEQFSDNWIGASYGTRFSNPGTNASNIDRGILSFGHYGEDKLGSNFFYMDLLKSNSVEPAAGTGTSSGAQEVFGLYSRAWSFSKIFDKKFEPGIVRDVSLMTRFDYGTKNDAFAAHSRYFTIGPTITVDVPGFLDVGLYAIKESSHNGIVGRDVNYKIAPKLGVVWGIPLSQAFLFRGFVDVVGPRGKDGFGYETKTETLLQAKLLADTGALANGKPNGFQVGIGVQYWHNKFGDDPAKFNPGSTKQTAPMLFVEYHL